MWSAAQNGLVWVAMNKIKQLLKKSPFLTFGFAVLGRIIPGYLQFRSLIKRFGRDASIMRTAWHGTGDYYICGMYLYEYLRLNEINNYVFLVDNKGSEAKVTNLFPVYDGHVVKTRSAKSLSRFSEFMGGGKPLCKSFECSDHMTFIGENLKGYRGMTMMDFYLHYGFGFREKPDACMPRYSQDSGGIRSRMLEQGLVPGKTVLLAPYSTCSKAYLPPSSFWEGIAVHLRKSGFAVATNCYGSELPVKGTAPLAITYSEVVPFLNEAGGFIGIRSGLCDIISQSFCQKIVIHTEKSDFWPDGRSESFVGLCQTWGDEAVVEFTYCGDDRSLGCKIEQIIQTW